MNPTRRTILQASAAAGAAASLVGCEKLISEATARLGEGVPSVVDVPDGASIDPAFHLLSRAAYGPWPGDVEHVRSVGLSNWIDAQLEPEKIDDGACTLRARRFETVYHDPGTCYEYKKPVLREEMARHTLLRAVYSKRQLFEVMVSFWTDHLNINIEKGDCIYLKPHDDREVIRKHTLGNFRNLIRASATSPAMLVYLDGKENARAKPADVPNENYGRELLELHTLGVDGGYTQRDVFEVARCLTGWRLRTKFRKGTVYFDRDFHDDDAKQVLGHAIPSSGREKDLDRVIDIVCRHPSTARHVARKLAQRFVSEKPPAALVDKVAGVFTRTDGDIKATVRAVLTSEEFAASAGGKFKPPFRFVASALRAVGADTHAHGPLVEYLTRMGQGIFQYPTPDGYPDEAAPWMGTLLWRWNLAFALAAGKVPTVNVPLGKLSNAIAAGAKGGAADGPGGKVEPLFRYFVGRAPTEAEHAALAGATKDLSAPSDLAALALASPAFQRY